MSAEYPARYFRGLIAVSGGRAIGVAIVKPGAVQAKAGRPVSMNKIDGCMNILRGSHLAV